jgi:hypothetical protein
MAVLLNAVTLDDWREVVTGAVQAAKGGDPQARAWLGQYLVGKPESKAPTAVSVIVNQLQGHNEVADRLASPLIQRREFPGLYGDPDPVALQIGQQIRLELADKMKQVETTENPVSMRASGDSDPE